MRRLLPAFVVLALAATEAPAQAAPVQRAAAAASCGDYLASFAYEVRTAGVSCVRARRFLRGYHRRCGFGANPARLRRCSYDGFRCTGTRAEAQAWSERCVSGTRRIRFVASP